MTNTELRMVNELVATWKAQEEEFGWEEIFCMVHRIGQGCTAMVDDLYDTMGEMVEELQIEDPDEEYDKVQELADTAAHKYLAEYHHNEIPDGVVMEEWVVID